MILLGSSFVLTEAQTTWNISESPFGAAASYSTSTTVGSLTISPKSGTPIAIDANTKSIDGYSFTYRLKLGATGVIADATNAPYLPGSAYVSFPVTAASTIIVYGMSSSSSATRTLSITDGSSKLAGFTNDGTAIGKAQVSYTGTGGTIYLYSESSGFNIYLIKVESATSGLNNTTANKGAVVATTTYDITGRQIAENSRGLVFKKVIYENGSSEIVKSFVEK